MSFLEINSIFLAGKMSFAEINSILLEGFGSTCLLFLLTLVLSLPLGLLVMFGSRCPFKPVAFLFRTFVWIIRGTPLMLQLFVVFYVPGMFTGYNPFLDMFEGLENGVEVGRFVAALIAFVINYSCYFSEIYRGGIESIPKGQYEACQVLGMTKTQTFFKVILMQVVKRILPPMSNEVITLVKDTSLARVIMVAEIFYRYEMEIGAKGVIWPLFYIGVFFLLFVGGLTILFNFIEKKLSYYKV